MKVFGVVSRFTLTISRSHDYHEFLFSYILLLVGHGSNKWWWKLQDYNLQNLWLQRQNHTSFLLLRVWWQNLARVRKRKLKKEPSAVPVCEAKKILQGLPLDFRGFAFSLGFGVKTGTFLGFAWAAWVYLKYSTSTTQKTTSGTNKYTDMPVMDSTKAMIESMEWKISCG